jgi:hypothetical protein
MEIKTYKSSSLDEIYKNISFLFNCAKDHPDMIGTRYVIEYDENNEVFILMYYAR